MPTHMPSLLILVVVTKITLAVTKEIGAMAQPLASTMLQITIESYGMVELCISYMVPPLVSTIVPL